MSEHVRVASPADRIKEAMQDANKKQADLVRETGLDRGAISSYLSGRYEPKQKAIGLLAIALDVNEMWLWGCDVPKERAPSQKKTDKLARLYDKMLRDPTLLDMVDKLAKMDDEQRASYQQIMDLLDKK